MKRVRLLSQSYITFTSYTGCMINRSAIFMIKNPQGVKTLITRHKKELSLLLLKFTVISALR